MFDIPFLDWLLWGWAITGLIWSLAPPIFSLLGFGSVRYQAYPDPLLTVPEDTDADSKKWFDQLRTLGFEPVGMVKESVWFLFAVHWVKRFFVRCLAMPDRKCFAAIYRLSPYERPRVSLTTITTGGGMVRTSMPGVGDECNEESYMRVEVESCSPSEFVARHNDNVSRFTRQRHVSAISETLEGYASVDERHEGQKLQKARINALVIFPLIGLGIPWIVSMGFLSAWPNHVEFTRTLAVSFGFAAIVYLLFLKVVLPKLVADECRSDHQARAERVW